MIFAKLLLKCTMFFSLISTLTLATSCNNSDKSENSSATTTTDTPAATPGDTTVNKNPNADTAAYGTRSTRRMGKISLAAPPAVDKTTAIKADDQGYYNYTETAPAYPGGQSALENYITNNIQYPDDAIDNEVEGTVYVMFTIDENGKVANAKTSGTKLGHGLEEEAVKVVNKMGTWSPGTNKGKKVKAWYTIPITYKLES